MSSWHPNAQGEIAVDWYVTTSFLMATLFLLMTPGPVMAIVAHNTLRDGATGGLKTAIGIELGEVCLLGVTFAGLMISGELLPALFRWISLAGDSICLACREPAPLPLYAFTKRACDRLSIPFLMGSLLHSVIPPPLSCYASFFPQFINFDHSIPEQILQLGAMYLCAALLFDLTCVLAFACTRLPGRVSHGLQVSLSWAARPSISPSRRPLWSDLLRLRTDLPRKQVGLDRQPTLSPRSDYRCTAIW